MNTNCLIDPKLIKKIQKRNNNNYKLNKDILYILIGLITGIKIGQADEQ